MPIVGDGRNKAIAALGNGFQIMGILGVILEDTTNPADREVQAMLEIHERVSSPDSFGQFLAGDDLSGSHGKDSQYFRRLRLELYRGAVAAKLPRSTVEYVVAERETLVRLDLCCHRCTPQRESGYLREVPHYSPNNPNLFLIGK
jgi:hypothetical protein